jgi:hypothetical protein
LFFAQWLSFVSPAGSFTEPMLHFQLQLLQKLLSINIIAICKTFNASLVKN